ncbi:MAG: hypothetical protein ABIY51_03600 [Ferruginibacter sp.]
MAFQIGHIKIQGTVGNTTYYIREGKALARPKSSLTKAKVKKHPAFARSRAASARFAIAAALSGRLYRQLPKKLRRHGMIGKLTGEAINFIHAGISEEQAFDNLYKKYCGK